MKELNFDFEQKQIKINGHVFDILKTDTDVMEKTAMLQKQAEALQKEVGKNSAESKMAVAKTIRDVIEYVDEVLGKGAMKKISGGKPVGFAMGAKIMNAIAQNVVEMYSADMDSEFGLDGDNIKRDAKKK